MKGSEFDILKEKIRERVVKSNDMDILVNEILKLPYGQIKKVMTDEVMEVLAKYGYTE